WDGMLLPIVGLTLLVGAAGGVYPAFYLSRFQPAQVLKANKSSAEASGTGRLRSVLVVAQFAVSIGLIICTAVVYGQTVYGRTVDPNRPGDDSTIPLAGDEPGAVAAVDAAERAKAARGINVVINELAARRLGFRDPAQAVGKTVMVSYFDPDDPLVPTHIIGVVQDSRFRSVRDPIDPILF